MPGEFNGRKKSLQQMVLRLVDIHMQKNEVSSFPYIINRSSKWTKDLSVRVEVTKFSEEHRGVNMTFS